MRFSSTNIRIFFFLCLPTINSVSRNAQLDDISSLFRAGATNPKPDFYFNRQNFFAKGNLCLCNLQVNKSIKLK